jgi:hypothetical protein
MRFPRLFLGGLGAVAFGAMVACGGGGDDESATATQTTDGGGSPTSTASPVDGPNLVNGLPACLAPGTPVEGSQFEVNADPALSGPAQDPKVSLVTAASDLYVGENNLAIGMATLEGQPIGGSTVRFTLYDLGGGGQKPVCQVEAAGSAPGVGPETPHEHGDGEIHVHGGEDEDRAVHYAHVSFSHAGNWGLAVEAILKDGTRAFGSLLFQVGEEPQTPAPGQEAIRSDNLTKDDVEDIREIDSGDPPNDMHDFKIRDLIESGRPMVIVFATPAYCVSAFCGPVTEEVEELYEDYKDRVAFVHIEIYRDFEASPPLFNPTAREWLLRPDGGLSEPVVYVVDKNGVIFDRWEGPVARNIMEGAVEAVAGGAVYE